MYLIFGNQENQQVNEYMAGWAAQIIWPGTDRAFGACGTMGVLERPELGALIGVVVFHNWQPDEGTIEISAASTSPRWLNRKVLTEIFCNCFDRMACQLVFSRVAPDDERTKRIYRAYGFSEMTLPRMRGRNKDEILFTLTDDSWRSSKWSLKHGQKNTSRT